MVHTSLINPGINTWARVKSRFYKRNTRRRENRKAYMRLTDLLADFKFENDKLPREMQSAFLKLRNALCLPRTPASKKITKAYEEYDRIQKDIVSNTKEFSELLAEYEKLKEKPSYKKTKEYLELMDKVKACQKNADDLHDELRNQTYIIKDHRRDHWRQCKKHTENVFSMNITAIREAATSGDLHKQLAKGGDDAVQLERQLRELVALIYKSYADDLYYSGDYKNPTNAIYFNKYLHSYQHALGLMSSIGCKSGTDRTKVLRDLIEATDARPLAKDPKAPQPGKEAPIIPENLHLNDVLIGPVRDNVEANIFKNSSAVAAVVDTGGGQSKVDTTKFPFLGSIPNVKFLSKLGKYAAHKMKKTVSEFIEGYMGKLARVRYAFHRALPSVVDPVKPVDERVTKYQKPVDESVVGPADPKKKSVLEDDEIVEEGLDEEPEKEPEKGPEKVVTPVIGSPPKSSRS